MLSCKVHVQLSCNLKNAIRFSQSLLFSRVSNPNFLSFFLTGEMLCPSNLLICLISGLAPQVHVLPMLRRQNWGVASPEQSRRTESLPLSYWQHCLGCRPGYSWISGLPTHIAGSCVASCQPSYFFSFDFRTGAGISVMCELDCSYPCSDYITNEAIAKRCAWCCI